ncbi:MAG: MFS transporter, partial [Burkholderiales bacterium]
MTADAGRKTALLLVACLTVMSAATIAPALPRMAAAFSAAPNAELLTKLVLTAPAVAIALCAPFAGGLVDRFGRVGILRASLVLYGLAGTAGYVLDDLYAILASRAALGVAVAGTMTSVTALVGDYYSGEARTRYAGLQSLVMSLGAVVCVAAGGLLADIGWRLPFLIYLTGWAVLVPVLLYVAEPRRAGATAVARGHGALPRGSIAAAYGITFFAVAMFYMIPVQMPFLLRAIGVESGAAAGAVVAAASLTAAAGSAWFARLRRASGVLGVYAWAFALMAGGYALAGLAGTFGGALAGAAVAGVGVGLFFPNSNLWVLALAPPSLRGQLAGGLTSAIFLAQFSSPILVHPLVAATSLARAFTIA